MATTPPAFAGERPRAPVFAYLPPAAAAVATLRHGQCRWPLGEVAEARFAFCTGDTGRGASYCAIHARLARPGHAAGMPRSGSPAGAPR